MAGKSILTITEEQKQAIRDNIKISREEIKKGIEAILEWFKKQQHLPRIDLDPRIIECILISRKGSVEQTKQKIDMMYTLRFIVPEMAAPRDVFSLKIQNALKGCTLATLPKLNKDYTRVSVVQYKDPDFFNIVDLTNFLWAIVEYRLLNDYFAGERYVVDMKDISLGHMTKFTPTLIKKFEMYIRKAYGIRIFGIHVINGSNFFNKLLALLKAGFTEKISSRIYLHETYEDLHKVIDKDILPREYGGNEIPVTEILEDWKNELSKEENREYLIKQEKLQSNEALRIGSKLDDELLGIAGSFKQLDVF